MKVLLNIHRRRWSDVGKKSMHSLKIMRSCLRNWMSGVRARSGGFCGCLNKSGGGEFSVLLARGVSESENRWERAGGCDMMEG